MSSNLAMVVPAESGLAVDAGSWTAHDFIESSLSENTKRAYASDFKQFSIWCAGRGVSPLPVGPALVADYFTHLCNIGRKSSSIDRARASIRMAHEAAGFEDPAGGLVVRKVLSGIRRTVGVARNKKTPVLSCGIKAMLETLPDGLLGVRDRAILLVGFSGAFRRSELVGIQVENVEFSGDGMKILLPFSKTDQEGAGRIVAIKRGSAACPVAALEAWLQAAGIKSGPVFRCVDRHSRLSETALTSQSIARIVKRAAVAAGIDASNISGHSLRSGFVTTAALAGASEANIARTTGHKSIEILRGYIRVADVFKDNASGLLGL